MKISLNWLKEYIDIRKSPQEISDALTQSGLEVEGMEEFEQIKGNLEGVVIGEVKTSAPHPNADKLSLTQVDLGNEELTPIVCGAPNVAAGQKVLVATVGTTLYPASAPEGFKIKKAKIRGEESFGMICAEDELGLGTSHDGIMVLNTELKNGTPAAEFLNLQSDTILEIGLTPNRADAASHIGVARDLKAIFKQELNTPDVSNFSVDNSDLPVEVIVEDQNGAPRYSGVTIKGVKIEPSPEWLQNKLKSIGLAPINNVVDITNFVLQEFGQPLHAFDYDRIAKKKVIVKTLKEGTKFTTLDEVERTLTSEDLMICDGDEDGMCIAGVFGGNHSGITDETQNIFLESAYFSPEYIRKTSMVHGLKTDAAFRFERGTDPNITVTALKRAAIMIREIAGGTISSEIIDIYPQAIPDFVIQVKQKNVDRLIGKHIPFERIKEILMYLDIEVSESKDGVFEVVVPPYRVDVQREADVIEEILRIYGYDNVEISESIGSDFLAYFPETDKFKNQLKVSRQLTANGYSEILTNSLTKPVYAEKSALLNENESVSILNKLSEDLGVMRQTLLFSGLEVVAHNINRKQDSLKLFEFGTSYKQVKNTYKENSSLALWATGNYEKETWRNKARPIEFHDIFAIVKKIINIFSVNTYDSQPISDDTYSYGLSIFLQGVEVARFGLLRKEILKLADIRQEVFFGELNFEALLDSKGKGFKYKEIPKFPEVKRDLSLVIDKSVTFEQIRDITRRREYSLVRRINVFDYYEGEKIGENEKAYAISFILQDDNKTLTDNVIDKVMSRLMQTFNKEINAVIRK